MMTGISTSLFGDRIIKKEEWAELKALGFKYIEIALLMYNRSIPEYKAWIDRYAKGVEEAGLKLWSLHLPYGWDTDITELDIEKQRHCEDIIRVLIEYAADMGFKIVVLHASFEPISQGDRNERLSSGNKMIKKLAEYTSSFGMELAIECLPRTCIGNTSDECLKLIENTKAKICMDVNHLFLETPEQFIHKLTGKIITTHISDNDGIDERHWVLGKGKIDFYKFFSDLEKENPEIPHIFEIRGGADVTTKAIMDSYKNIYNEYAGLCDQKNKRIIVCNINNFSRPVWEWTVDDAQFANISSLKFRYHDTYGNVMMVCSSEGFFAMVSYPEGNILWKSYAAGNLHSIELLSDGRIALAASDGNFIRIYSSPDKYIEQYLEQAHGVLYDPERNSLWALGKHTLAEYDIHTLEQRGNIYDFSDTCHFGHDLAPYYNNSNFLWFTAHEGVFVYNKQTNKCEPGITADITKPNTKGIGNTPYTNSVISVCPNESYLPWCTDTVNIFSHGEHNQFVNTADAYYKIRVWCKNYQ